MTLRRWNRLERREQSCSAPYIAPVLGRPAGHTRRRGGPERGERNVGDDRCVRSNLLFDLAGRVLLSGMIRMSGWRYGEPVRIQKGRRHWRRREGEIGTAESANIAREIDSFSVIDNFEELSTAW